MSKTIQKQVQKEYTFEEICPDWNDIIAAGGSLSEGYEAQDGTTRNLSSCPVCIVGEAHSYA